MPRKTETQSQMFQKRVMKLIGANVGNYRPAFTCEGMVILVTPDGNGFIVVRDTFGTQATFELTGGAGNSTLFVYKNVIPSFVGLIFSTISALLESEVAA